MRSSVDSDDGGLVEQCLDNDRNAWDEFYVRFLPLIRKAVQRRAGFLTRDIEDIVQEVFLSLANDLKTYDPRYPLSKFVWIIADRVCIDTHRRSAAAKRDGDTISVDCESSGVEAAVASHRTSASQEDLVAGAQSVRLLRAALTRLGRKCEELLRLRYFDDLPFKDISEKTGIDKKTLAVQAGRCIDELRARFAELERKGIEP
jgi:RNA polymerase sigma factor (sigma-70 family)